MHVGKIFIRRNTHRRIRSAFRHKAELVRLETSSRLDLSYETKDIVIGTSHGHGFASQATTSRRVDRRRQKGGSISISFTRIYSLPSLYKKTKKKTCIDRAIERQVATHRVERAASDMNRDARQRYITPPSSQYFTLLCSRRTACSWLLFRVQQRWKLFSFEVFFQATHRSIFVLPRRQQQQQ